MGVPRSLQHGVGQHKQAHVASVWLEALPAAALGPPSIHIPAAIARNALAHELLHDMAQSPHFN